jgi:hypothetical protein
LFELAELRELRDEFGIVRWVQGILVLELRHKQLQEIALPQFFGPGGSGRIGGGLRRRDSGYGRHG